MENNPVGPPAVGERWKDLENAAMLILASSISAGLSLMGSRLGNLNYTNDGIPVLTLKLGVATVRIGVVARVVAREDEADEQTER